MAAISAAREGAAVTVLEGMDRPGKKLLMTGNGRCNLTSTDEQIEKRYRGTGAALAATVIRSFDVSATLGFFHEIGLLTAEKNGGIYPYTGQAQAVLDVLLMELRRLKIKLKLSEKVQSVRQTDEGWSVQTATWQYPADRVILCCGSRAVPATGSDGSGYEIAGQLGIGVVTPAPALVPLLCREKFLSQCAGVRCRSQVSLYEVKNGQKQLLGRERGELQWTAGGISGIVVFQLSGLISRRLADGLSGFQVLIDLLPDDSEPSLVSFLRSKAERFGHENTKALLTGLLPDKLIPVVLQCAQIRPQTLASDLTENQILAVITNIKEFQLQVTGTRSFDVCQVCTGGVDASEVSHTLEAIRYPGLYVAGELLDVDGPCGGYNLQWAWSSGYIAGHFAAQVG
jgi:predicted Rossmann fold flavoprotein